MSRRDRSNQRLRLGFLTEAAHRVRALADQLKAMPDAAPELAFELERLAEQAGTLKLDEVALAAREAGHQLGGASLGLGALRRAARAVREARGPLRVGPVIVVGGTDAERDALRRRADLVPEPLELYADVASFASDVHAERPHAVVVPIDALDTLHTLVSDDFGVPLAHGDATDADAVRRAREAGAQAVIEGPMTLALLREVRRRSHLEASATVVGAMTRCDVLIELERALGRYHRDPEPLTVALVDLVGDDLDETLHRRVTRWLLDGFRSIDAIGELGLGRWLIVLERCRREDAALRFAEVAQAHFTATTSEGTRLVGGLADTGRGVRGLVTRAERDLGAQLATAL